jgi:hypothetical protein
MNPKQDRAVIVWACPECDWLITDVEYTAAAFNYPCGRCRRATLSMFRRRNLKSVTK